MALGDILPVLEGIASAYGMIDADSNMELQHRVRIAGARKESADILLGILDAVGKVSAPLDSTIFLPAAMFRESGWLALDVATWARAG